MKFEINAIPEITFLLYSSTIKFRDYDLTNVPTSTGRADMLIRVIRTIMYNKNTYESKMGLIFFPNANLLEELSEFSGGRDINSFLVCSRSSYFQNTPFKIPSEHELLTCFYESLMHLNQEYSDSLFYQSYSMNIYECIDTLVNNGVKAYLLHENGRIIKSFDKSPKKKCFLLGDQLGYNDMDFTRFPSTLEKISLGSTSYLGSSAITLIKWMLWEAGAI